MRLGLLRRTFPALLLSAELRCAALAYQRCLSGRLNRLCRATCQFQLNTTISIIVFASVYEHVVTRSTGERCGDPL